MTYLWMREEVNWVEASVRCRELSADLFDEYEGSEEQASFLFGNMRGQGFFLGFSDTEEERKWMNMQQQDFGLLQKNTTLTNFAPLHWQTKPHFSENKEVEDYAYTSGVGDLVICQSVQITKLAQFVCTKVSY